jgi:CheY-like chemotaxis protein
VPIVACTANAMQGEAESCLAAGMDDFLVKPVELAQLSEKLDRWLPLAGATQAPATPVDASRDDAPASRPIDEALLSAKCAGDASMVAEVLAAFRQTCQDDSTALRQAVAAEDAAQVTQFAHRMAGAGKMVGALAFASACENVERASRGGNWKNVEAGMPAFEDELMSLFAYFERHGQQQMLS